MAKRNKEALLMALAQALNAFVRTRQHRSEVAERRDFMSRNDKREAERHQAIMRNYQSLDEARKKRGEEDPSDDLLKQLRIEGLSGEARTHAIEYLTASPEDQAAMRQQWSQKPYGDPMEGADPEEAKAQRARERALVAAANIRKRMGGGKVAPAAGVPAPVVGPPSPAASQPTLDPKYSALIDGIVGGPGAGMQSKLSAFGPQPRSDKTGSPNWVPNLAAAVQGPPDDPMARAERERTIGSSMSQHNGTPLDRQMAGEFALLRSLVTNPNTPIYQQAMAYAGLQKYGIEPPDDIKVMLFGMGQNLASLREGVRDPSMLGQGAIGQPQIQAAMQNPVGVAPQPAHMSAYSRVRDAEMNSEASRPSPFGVGNTQRTSRSGFSSRLLGKLSKLVADEKKKSR